MPNKHFYFALGATCGAALAVGLRRHYSLHPCRGWMRVLCRRKPSWFLYLLPVMTGLFGLLALVPDALYAVGALPKAVIRGTSFNIFFGYAWFEKIEDIEPTLDHTFNTIGSMLLYGISLGGLGFYAREYQRLIDRVGEPTPPLLGDEHA